MRRLVWAGLIAFLIAPAIGQQALAGEEWCSDDPVIVVEGRQAKVTTSFRYAYLESLTQPMRFELVVPSNVRVSVSAPARYSRELVVTRSLEPWKGAGEIRVIARVTVSASAEFYTVTAAAGPALEERISQDGVSNRTIELKLELLKPGDSRD